MSLEYRALCLVVCWLLEEDMDVDVDVDMKQQQQVVVVVVVEVRVVVAWMLGQFSNLVSVDRLR